MTRRFAARISSCAAAAALIALLPAAQAAAQTMPPWTKWIATLQEQGYAVTRGAAHEYTTKECKTQDYPIFHSCFGDSYTDPYIMLEPPVGAEFIDPDYGVAGYTIGQNGLELSRTYRLDPTEAMLTIVTLPPLAAYFSAQTYLFTRDLGYYPGGVQALSPDPQRALLFATESNSINNVMIQQQTGLGFGQGSVAIITTSNAALAASLAATFTQVGGNTALLFNDALGNTLYPGLGQTADEFMTVLRYAVPQDPHAGRRWRDSVGFNVAVYRVGQPAGAAVQPYGATPLLTKSYNTPELVHENTVAELAQILSTWLAGIEKHPVATTPAISSEQVGAHGTYIAGLVGPICIAAGTYCTGDEQDSDTYAGANIGLLASSDSIVVAGVDHTVLNNTTYQSIAVQDAHRQLQVVDGTQTNPAAAGFANGSLTGSAAQALVDLGLYNQASPGLMADLPNLYVHIFAHICPSKQVYCTRTYTTKLPSNLPASDELQAVERAYVLPGALNGANPRYITDPLVIH